MAITYDELRQRIGFKAGYGTSGWDSNQTTNIGLALESALSRVFDPMILPGESEKHQWSFLTPTMTIDLTEGVYAYDLPPQFSSFVTPLFHAPGSNDWYPPIQIMGAEEVQKRLAMSDDNGVPCAAGVRVKPAHGVHKTVWELIVHPSPDADYQVKGQMRINPTVPGGDDDVPLGGQPHEQTLVLACLCEAVILLNDEADVQLEQRFIEALRSSISHDRQISGARTLGYLGDPGLYRGLRSTPIVDDWNIPPLTFQGLDSW